MKRQRVASSGVRGRVAPRAEEPAIGADLVIPALPRQRTIRAARVERTDGVTVTQHKRAKVEILESAKADIAFVLVRAVVIERCCAVVDKAELGREVAPICLTAVDRYAGTTEAGVLPRAEVARGAGGGSFANRQERFRGGGEGGRGRGRRAVAGQVDGAHRDGVRGVRRQPRDRVRARVDSGAVGGPAIDG